MLMEKANDNQMTAYACEISNKRLTARRCTGSEPSTARASAETGR
jgi:hypothetical protein